MRYRYELVATVFSAAVLFVPLATFAMETQRIEVFQGGALIGKIDPYTGPLTSAANYNYIQPSGSPIYGPAPTAFQGRLFFYMGSDGLSFNILLNTGAIGQGTVNWTIAVAGSTTDPFVLLSDDPQPPANPQELIESPDNFFTGTWSYAGNTDGGVIGPLSGSAWTITVNQWSYGSDRNTGITSLRAFDDSGAALPLNLHSGSAGQLVFRPETVPEPTAATLLALAIAMVVGTLRLR